MTGLLGIPDIRVPEGCRKSCVACGGNSYVTTVEGVTRKEYESYLDSLVEAGFVCYADNGEGIGGTVLCSTWTRESIVLTATYYAGDQAISISFYEGNVSEHLNYQDAYLTGNLPGARTKLYMRDLWWFGSSFIFRLKNGHFVVSDGGRAADLPYLLDDLEKLAPKGEIPVVEAWVISHAHEDHCGALNSFVHHPEWRGRIKCDGVYFCEPSERVLFRCGSHDDCGMMKMAAYGLRDTSGKKTSWYRMQTGQRYYFNDITMDVLLCQEQVAFDEYDDDDDLNVSSTICMFEIEGQKCFFSGDIHQSGLQFVMRNYPREYLDLTLYTLNHHGYNTYPGFGDYANIRTMLLTVAERLPVRQVRENREFLQKAQEKITWGSGTKVLTFPYEMGSYECLPKREWIYNEGEERKLQPNMFTFPNRTLACVLFDGDAVLWDGNGIRPGVAEFMDYLRKQGISHIAVYGAQTREKITKQLEEHQLATFVDLVMGSDEFEANGDPSVYMKKAEEVYRLDSAQKYLVICDGLTAVEAAVAEGYRSLVIRNGKTISEELVQKSWKQVDTYEDIYRLFKTYKIYPSHRDTGILFE